MKRPRSSIAALFTAATAVLSPSPLLPLASSQSLRASYSPSTVDGEGSSGGSFVETQQQQQHKQQQQQTADTSVPLTVKLSTSSHHRGHIAAPNNNNNNNNSNYSNNYKKSKQTNPLGSADGTTNGNGSMPEIPLVGIGVGNLPHNKIPYILANALGGGGSNSNSNSNNKALKEMNYKLIDTSHTSALEVLVGRSLSRLLTTTNTNNTSNYHVMIKIWHTHLGYERTMMSIQDSLADIIPGSNPAAKKVANGMMSSSSISGSRSSMGKSSSSTNNNNNNNNKSIRIHAILQYPRCYDTLFQSQTYLSQSSHTSSSSSSNNSPPFSSCQDEEHALDSTVKSAGPSPLLDKDNAWKRSYRALEELYHHGSLESIGIANFGPSDMTLLYDIATVGPHVYQGSLRALLLEQELVEGLVKHGVHYQVYDAPSAVVRGREKAPRAYAKLERMGARHGGIEEEDYASSSSSSSQGGGGGFTSSSSYGYSAVQLVLGWLVQRGVGVIPGTKDVTHLIENGPLSLAEIPNFSPRENLDIEIAVLALVQGVDLEDENVVRRNNIMNNNNVPGMGEFGSEEIYINGQPLLDNYGANREEDDNEGVVATFFNALRRNIRIFHVHPNTGQQLQISQSIPPGRSGRLIVNPSDVLIAYDGHGVAVRKFLVEGDHGGRVDFSVEL